MRKFAVYMAMFFVAAIIAGMYGVIHDQISYTLSNEYFTHFKFIQFGTPWAYDEPRLGAAYVGFMATWWMGVLISSILSLFGFMFRSPYDMAIHLVKSFMVVLVTALVTGLAGLAYGYFQVDQATVVNYTRWLPDGVADPVQFVRVGFMHNASYLGGLVGLLAGILYLIVSKKRYYGNKAG